MTDRDTDLLISRILDRQAEPAEFDAFAATAGAEPSAWNDLLAALRDDVALGVATDVRLDLAERVQEPVIESRASRTSLHPWPGWSGWAAALLLACAWLGWSGYAGGRSALPPDRTGEQLLAGGPARELGPQPGTGGTFGSDSPRLRAGAVVPVADHVLGELPPELISTRPAVGGEGLEVVYVRRVLERARVDSAWSLGTDELGRPAPISVDLALLTGSDLH